MSEKQATQDAEEPKKGIVLYTDGGCRPNPGFGGWGIHGYMFSFAIPKKGSGNPDHILTARGYVLKSESPNQPTPERRNPERTHEVTPIHYIDGFGGFPYDVSNNIGEIVATTQGLIHAAEFDVQDVQIFTDSEYVKNGLESWVDKWEANDWKKADGTEPSNLRYWKELILARNTLRQRGANVRISWVKGHTDKLKDDKRPIIIGNIMADQWATLGVSSSRNKKPMSEIAISVAEGYWKNEVERHPFIANRRMYFNTLRNVNKPGEYYLGETGKEEDLFGKRISDGAFAVVQLERPDPVIEFVRDRQVAMSGNLDSIIMLCLDKLYRPRTHTEISKYGELAVFKPNPFRLDLECLDEQPLTRELRPPKLAMRAVTTVSELLEKLQLFLAKDSSIVVTDLTPILYETTVKVDKKGVSSSTTKLKSEYNVGFAALPVEAAYQAGNEVKTAPCTLTLGIDLLDRNALKRLEDTSPKVSLITWLEDDNVFRYATIIESGNDRGIWCGVYSNLRIVT